MNKDKLFARPRNNIAPFEFNREVAGVFDDMLHRSVPLYRENILYTARLASRYAKDGANIYDLGCSHGNLGMAVANEISGRRITMVAVDSSLPMIKKYQQRLDEFPQGNQLHLVCCGMENILIRNACVVLMNLTLQFLKRELRQGLINSIYQGLNPGGILILTEKLSHSSREVDLIYDHFYRQYKRENGYSELEISQKRDALEKVLVPDTIETHLSRLQKAGFSTRDVWLKWFNFASILAIKQKE